MLVIGCQTIEKVFARLDSKGVWILGEVAVLEHVVDVIPNRFEGDTEFPVVVHHILGLTPVLVAPATLVEAEAPVRHHDSLADDFGVLLCSLNGSRPGNEVEVDDSTNGVVLEELSVGIVNLDVHA